MSYWARRARADIQRGLAAAPSGVLCAARTPYSESVLRKWLRQFYTFGPRTGYPYRVWLREVRAALQTWPVRHQGACDPVGIKCRACGAAVGRACRPEAEFEHALLVAHDAEQEGRRDLATSIRLQAFHETRRIDAGIEATP